VLPIWELFMDKMSEGSVRIATRALKWDLDYQSKHQIKIGPASDLSEDQMRRLVNVGKRIYRVLELSGYARLDFRLDAEDRPYFLEANPNPDIARVEEFASAAEAAGLSYESLLHKMLTLGMQRAAARRS